MLIVTCPHCGEYVEIIELNCRIFRHGVYKKNMTQINPHMPQPECEALVKADEIYGCGKPFRINAITAEICDYI